MNLEEILKSNTTTLEAAQKAAADRIAAEKEYKMVDAAVKAAGIINTELHAAVNRLRSYRKMEKRESEIITALNGGLTNLEAIKKVSPYVFGSIMHVLKRGGIDVSELED
jgi:biopolymer transport protein ExbB/TolQ